MFPESVDSGHERLDRHDGIARPDALPWSVVSWLKTGPAGNSLTRAAVRVRTERRNSPSRRRTLRCYSLVTYAGVLPQLEFDGNADAARTHDIGGLW